MNLSVQSLILGTTQQTERRLLLLGLVLGGFLVTFGGYAVGVFSVSGGVVFLPFYATIVGVLTAFWVGLTQSGLLLAWLAAYTPLLGFHVEAAVLGPTAQRIGERLADLIQLDAFVFLGVEALIFGSIAFAVGTLLRAGFDVFQERFRFTLSENHE